MNWWTIFLTGLTTGGLSCLAMQGGILASAIANQKDEELEQASKKSSSKKKMRQIANTSPGSFDQLDWLPVGMFLVGKIISHTIFGFFLGFLGSQLELSLAAKLIFQGIAGLFMFATAMNLLEVHPMFRYVVFQPPKFFTRLVRNSAKSKAVFMPFLIGVLTLLIPCGVTQSMEVLAMTSGSPILGAGIMFTFVLGTSPLFGILGVGVAKLSEVWSKTFMQVAALSLIILSVSSLNGILVVLDSPITLQKIKTAVLDPAGVTHTGGSNTAQVVDGVQNVVLNILNSGYSPNRIQVKAGTPVNLTLINDDAYTCASAFVFPEFNISTFIEVGDSETFTFVPEKKGRYTFACSMGMYTGVMEVI